MTTLKRVQTMFVVFIGARDYQRHIRNFNYSSAPLTEFSK